MTKTQQVLPDFGIGGIHKPNPSPAGVPPSEHKPKVQHSNAAEPVTASPPAINPRLPLFTHVLDVVLGDLVFTVGLGITTLLFAAAIAKPLLDPNNQSPHPVLEVNDESPDDDF